MPDIPFALCELVEELRTMEDEQLKMELLIEFGEKFEEVPNDLASRPFSEKNKIPACESEAYLFPRERNDGTLDFFFAVENPQGISAKALAYILQSTLSGAPLVEVSNISEDVAYDIFGRSLSMGKGLGLTSMIRSVKHAAMQFEKKTA